MTALAANLSRFRTTFKGDVIAPDDEGYDLARRVWNARFNGRRPGVIARPTNTADVATAIRFGRDNELEIAVRSGAHSNSGHSTVDDGLVIDMSAMRGVAIDAERRTARVDGGTLLGE